MAKAIAVVTLYLTYQPLVISKDGDIVEKKKKKTNKNVATYKIYIFNVLK